jgi:hypothetical protein
MVGATNTVLALIATIITKCGAGGRGKGSYRDNKEGEGVRDFFQG